MNSRLLPKVLALFTVACIGLGGTLCHFRLPMLDQVARHVPTAYLPPAWVEALAEHHLAEARANLSIVERQLRDAESRDRDLTSQYLRFQHEEPAWTAQVAGLNSAAAARPKKDLADTTMANLTEARCALERMADGENTVHGELLSQRVASWNLIRDLTRRRDEYRCRILKLEARRSRLEVELEQRHTAQFGLGRAEAFFNAAGVAEGVQR